jgi:hypothetical protein
MGLAGVVFPVRSAAFPAFFSAIGGAFHRRLPGTALFPGGFFQHPQGFVKALEEILEIIRKKNHRLPLEGGTRLLVFAFHDVEVQIPQAVFLDIEKVGPVFQDHLC